MRLLGWLKQHLRNPFHHGTDRNSPRRRDLVADLWVTQLETRRVLNADGVASELVIDAGTSADDGQADSFDIRTNQDQIEVTVNGELVHAAPWEQLSKITILGSSDDDLITADLGSGLPKDLQLSVNGFAGDDTLRMVHQGILEDVSHTFGQSGGGLTSITAGNSSVQVEHEGIEAIEQDLTTKSLLFRLHDGAELVTLSSVSPSGDSSSSHSRLQIQHADSSSPASNQPLSVIFNNPLEQLQIDASSQLGNVADADSIEVIDWHRTLDSDFLFHGDHDDSLRFSGDTTWGSGSLYASAGDVEISGRLHANESTLVIHATDSLTINQ